MKRLEVILVSFLVIVVIGFAQAATIDLTAPNGGEAWPGGSSQSITWNTSGPGVDHIRLLYSTDGGSTYPNIINTGTDNDGIYEWTIPGINSSTVRVKAMAEDISNTVLAEDASNGNFTIDSIAPSIVSSVPLPGATDVPLEIDFSVTFSERMNETSVFNSLLELKDMNSDATISNTSLQNLVGMGSVSASFNSSGDFLSITSTTELEPSTTYQITITTLTATDIAGNLLDTADTQFVFRTVGYTFHVDDDAAPGGDGSPERPFQRIQYGIDAASDGDTVLVADGIYMGSDNVNLDFEGRVITVKSENGPENCIIDCENVDDTRGFHFHSGETSDSIVDGFTIRNGKAVRGGGILCDDGSFPTIANNIITGNSADSGGGIHCDGASSPTIMSNTITGNSANSGGAILCSWNSSAMIMDNTITANSANRGGGIVCSDSSPAIRNNIITNNSANIYGGGIVSLSNSSPTIANNIVSGNWAIGDGGAIYFYGSGSSIITNNTITGNSAVNGGGLFCSSGSSPAITDTILWNNSPQEIYFNASLDPNTVTISYSDVQGGLVGIVTNSNGTVNWLNGNMDMDPLFVNAANGDYHLFDNSPCIGAGIMTVGVPNTDIEGNPRPNPAGSNPDMGAYENSLAEPLPYMFQREMGEGWNLVSTPYQPFHDTIDVALQSIAGLYNSVWRWVADPAYLHGGYWMLYDPAAPLISDLGTFDAGNGYWIDMKDSAVLILSSEGASDEPIQLKQGWNLTGYNSTVEQSVEEALSSIAGHFDSVWTWIPDLAYATGGYWMLYDPEKPLISDLKTLKPGMGLWMDAIDDWEWSINGGGQPAPILGHGDAGTRGRGDMVSSHRPDMPYIIWGSVQVDGVMMKKGTTRRAPTVVLKVDNEVQASCPLGAVGEHGDLYKLEVPVTTGRRLKPATPGSSAQAELYVQIHDTLVKAAPVPLGRPGQIIRFDLSVQLPPKVSLLHQNYPNPFNPDTWIPYQLEEDTHVVIRIYTSTGQLMRTLDLGYKPAGFYTDKEKAAYWDGKNEAGEHVASGVYFYNVKAGDFTATRKMIIMK
jgi:parallel beta-helix repeat protein